MDVYLGIGDEDALPYFGEAEEHALYQWREGKKQAQAQKAAATRAKKAG